MYSKRLASAVSQEIEAAEARCPARMCSSRHKLRFRGIIQRLDLLLDIATRSLIPGSVENVDARVESECASYTMKRSWRRALSNRLVDEPKVLLSRKGHREYASAPSSRFTFSSLVHLLLLHGIRRSQVFEPAICTGRRAGFSHRLIVARFSGFLHMYTDFSLPWYIFAR